MRDNESKPTDSELIKWARMTDNNDHLGVRMEIAKWAQDNTTDKEIKAVIKRCARGIKDMYHSDSHKWLDTACKLTNVMMAAIEAEYGIATASLIHSTL